MKGLLFVNITDLQALLLFKKYLTLVFLITQVNCQIAGVIFLSHFSNELIKTSIKISHVLNTTHNLKSNLNNT